MHGNSLELLLVAMDYKYYCCNRFSKFFFFFVVPPNIASYVICVSVLMHFFVVALTVKKASPTQKQGLPTKKRFETPRVAHGTHLTHA